VARELIGHFILHEGTSNIGFALISPGSLAAYEAYRGRLPGVAEGMANFDSAENHQFIVAQEPTF
jgi:hypothetical protein